jgi:hypothetical protein
MPLFSGSHLTSLMTIKTKPDYMLRKRKYPCQLIALTRRDKLDPVAGHLKRTAVII